MSLPAIVWVFQHSQAKLGARLVLLALAEFAHDDGTKAFPTIETLTQRTLLSERAVQLALRRLEDDGEIARTGATHAGVNVYRILGLGGVQNLHPGGAKNDAGGVQSLHPTQEQDPSSKPYEVVSVAWSQNAPPLIAHRESYFTSDKTRRAISAALKVYSASDVSAAIFAYATVLGGDEYRWDYSWTLRDFLQRGLDRFVPEAKPLENFRRRDGRASRHDFDDIDHLG